ncbi:MAG: serine/threonine protein kinase [Rhodanobacteraceae bacterium]|nr:serine/threonine protein kinase [Rhodanobacteraceae bacterium]
MTSEQGRYWQVKSLYLRLLEAAPGERAALLDAACAGDPRLRGEVQALLDAAAASPNRSPLADTATAVADATFDPPPVPDLPAAPAGYALKRLLGRGGMGEVWLAEREHDGFRQQVALKLLHRDAWRQGDRQARLRSERRILASLDHPHIARLYDGGTLPDGTPYLAMEFVDGERLDTWVARTRPGLRPLVQVLASIARALQAAHQRLVVHRDLKPANILIDSYGAPKLLDFGIAKLLDDTTPGVDTATGEQLLTPRYAAPEQIRGEAISTATDVYSFGVMAYELLTGSLPYAEAQGTPALLRAIVESEPIRASSAALADSTTGITRSALRGDIDAILMKCLRKDAAARYRGAAELADDLDAYLHGLPVAARAGSRRYALAKFAARHRYLVGSAALVLAVVLASAGLLWRQLEATRQQRDLAAHQRDKAEQVTAFLVELLRNADPTRSRGEDVSIRQALERGAQTLDTRLAGHADTRAWLYAQLALIHAELGDPERSLALAELAVGTAAQAQISPSERRAIDYAHAVALLKSGRGAEAVDTLQEIAHAAGAAGEALQAGDAWLQLGTIAQERRDTAQARAAAGQASAILLRLLGVADLAAAEAVALRPETEPVLARLAALAQLQCSIEADARAEDLALALCTSTAALKRRVFAPDHPTHLVTAGTLAMLMGLRGERQAALAMREDILARTRQVFGPTHTRTGYAQFNLAVSYSDTGDFTRAEEAYRQALATLEQQLGADHRSTLVVKNNLALLLVDHADPAAGLALCQELLADRRRVLGESHPDVAQSLMNLASAQARNQDRAGAVLHSQQARDMYLALLGPDNHDSVLATYQLALREWQAGQLEPAQAHATQALAAYERLAEAPDERGATRFLLARITWDLGQHPRAREIGAQALEEARQHGGPGFELSEVQAWVSAHGG